MAVKNNKERKQMETSETQNSKTTVRSYFNKLKNPSQFSKPQLAIFVIAFGLIGYLLFKTFAAAPLVASI